MISPAPRIKIAVMAPRTIRISQKMADASLNASRLRPRWSSSVNTGTNAADKAACANRLLTRFGIWEATLKAESAAELAEEARAR